MTERREIPDALVLWQKEHRPLTNHVQWWSYLYGYVLGKWPRNFVALRSDILRAISRTEWFDEGLNRGARAYPAGYGKLLREAEGRMLEIAGAR